MAEGRVHLTTFIEGILVHGRQTPFVLLVPSPHSPHRGLLMPAQIPWSPGFLPTALLNAQIEAAWGMPFRFVDSSVLPVVFDERTSRLPTPWLLRRPQVLQPRLVKLLSRHYGAVSVMGMIHVQTGSAA